MTEIILIVLAIIGLGLLSSAIAILTLIWLDDGE